MNSGNRLSNRICVFTLLLALMLLLLTGSSSNQAAEVSEGTDGMFYAHVNGSVLPILAADNSSADAFLDLLKAGDVTIDMHDYGSFEKVGSLGTTLSRNDEQITTEPGDVILYQGNQVTIYYDVNSWDFTRLGKVQGLSQAELKEILGAGNATVTFSLSDKQPGQSTGTGAKEARHEQSTGRRIKDSQVMDLFLIREYGPDRVERFCPFTYFHDYEEL